MLREFESFKDLEAKHVKDIPSKWSEEYLVYQLCDGDGSKREYYLSNWTYAQAIKWFLLRRYDSFAQREQLKK